MTTAESLAAGTEVAKAQESQHRTYTAVLTIEESTNENGQVTYMAHSTPLEESVQQPTTFRERMNHRQERYWGADGGGEWHVCVKCEEDTEVEDEEAQV